jgi:hypothetical protein
MIHLRAGAVTALIVNRVARRLPIAGGLISTIRAVSATAATATTTMTGASRAAITTVAISGLRRGSITRRFFRTFLFWF